MSNPGDASQEYLRNAVMTATPEKLQLMLYDGAIRFAIQGADAIRRQDREAAFNALDRAQRIVLEMANGIRREVNPTLADQVAALYSFVYRRLVAANLHQDVQAVEDALRILRHMRETWVMLMEKIQRECGAGISPAPPNTAAPVPASPGASRFQPETPPSCFSAEG